MILLSQVVFPTSPYLPLKNIQLFSLSLENNRYTHTRTHDPFHTQRDRERWGEECNERKQTYKLKHRGKENAQKYIQMRRHTYEHT